MGLCHKGSLPLETDRLIIKPLEPFMAKDAFHNWTSDQEVAHFMRWAKHKIVEETLDWILLDKMQRSEKSNYNWGIFEKSAPDIPIGSIGAFLNVEYPGRFEVGYALGKKWWNKGYMKEALKKVMQFLREDVGIKYFVCMHAIDNPASGKVMQNAGFIYKEDATYLGAMGTFHSKVYFLDVE